MHSHYAKKCVTKPSICKGGLPSLFLIYPQVAFSFLHQFVCGDVSNMEVLWYMHQKCFFFPLIVFKICVIKQTDDPAKTMIFFFFFCLSFLKCFKSAFLRLETFTIHEVQFDKRHADVLRSLCANAVSYGAKFIPWGNLMHEYLTQQSYI